MQICTTSTVHDVQQTGEQSDEGDVEQPDNWQSEGRNEHNSKSKESDDEFDDIVDVEDRVEAAIHAVATTQPDHILTDWDEPVQRFLQSSCGCTLQQGKPCSSLFSAEQMMKTRLDMKDLTKNELDLVILGKISALSKREGKSISGRMEGPRKAARTTFMHGGEVVCRKTFLQLHCVGLKRLKNLIRHYQQYGLTT